MGGNPTKLGEMLQQAGLIDQFQLDSALSYQRNVGGRIGSALIKLGYIAEETILEFLANQSKFSRVDLKTRQISAEVLQLIPAGQLFEHLVIPVEMQVGGAGKTLLVAMSDPTNLKLIDDLQFIAGCRVKPVVAAEFDIQTALNRHFPGGRPAPRPARPRPTADAASELAAIDFSEPALHPPAADRLDRLIALLLEKGLLTDRDVDRLK